MSRNSLVPRSGLGGRAWLDRQTTRELRAVEGAGLVAAAQVEAIAGVTSIALQEVGLLTELESQLLKQNPLGEERYKTIVDTATIGMATVIARLR